MEELRKLILQNYPTWQKFEKEQGVEQLIVNYDAVRRLSDVFYSTPVTLKSLSEIYPQKNTLSGLEYLKSWLLFLNDFLNINKGIQPKYVNQLAYTLYAKHSHFRLSDLKLLFDLILESRYGTFYGSVDTQRIATSFFEYNREREDVFTRILAKQQEDDKKETVRQKNPPDFSKLPNLRKLAGFDVDVSRLGVKLSDKMKT